MTLAGIPTATALFGISWVTTAFAPMATLLPILRLPKTFTPIQKSTLSPIVIGCPSSPVCFCPITTPGLSVQFRPIFAVGLINVKSPVWNIASPGPQVFWNTVNLNLNPRCLYLYHHRRNNGFLLPPEPFV